MSLTHSGCITTRVPRTVGYLIDDLDVPDADLPDSLYLISHVYY